MRGCRMQLEDAQHGMRLCHAMLGERVPGFSSGPGVPSRAELCQAAPCPSSTSRVACCHDNSRGWLKIASRCLFWGFLLRAHLQTAPRSPSAVPWVQGLPGDPQLRRWGLGQDPALRHHLGTPCTLPCSSCFFFPPRKSFLDANHFISPSRVPHQHPNPRCQGPVFIAARGLFHLCLSFPVVEGVGSSSVSPCDETGLPGAGCCQVVKPLRTGTLRDWGHICAFLLRAGLWAMGTREGTRSVPGSWGSEGC